MMLEKTLESPLDCKEIQPVHPKWHQSWIFTGRTDVKAETPILWPADVKNWLIWKDPDAGKDWKQEEKGTTEDEMVGWHHRLDGHEFEQALGVGDGQGSLVCCSPWGHKGSDMIEWLNWTDLLLPITVVSWVLVSSYTSENRGTEWLSDFLKYTQCSVAELRMKFVLLDLNAQALICYSHFFSFKGCAVDDSINGG